MWLGRLADDSLSNVVIAQYLLELGHVHKSFHFLSVQLIVNTFLVSSDRAPLLP